MKTAEVGRLKEFKLEVNSKKTRIIYAGRYNEYDHESHSIPRKFTFLGYEFKPRGYKGKTVYTPAIGQGAMKMIRQKLQEMGIMSKTQEPIEVIAAKINPVCGSIIMDTAEGAAYISSQLKWTIK